MSQVSKDLLILKVVESESCPIYAIKIEDIQEVLLAEQFKKTKPFNANNIEFLLMLRKEVIPTIRLSKYFGMLDLNEEEDKKPSDTTIIINYKNKKIGLIIEKVLTIESVELNKEDLVFNQKDSGNPIKFKDGSVGILINMDLLLNNYFTN